MSYYRWRRS